MKTVVETMFCLLECYVVESMETLDGVWTFF